MQIGFHATQRTQERKYATDAADANDVTGQNAEIEAVSSAGLRCVALR